MEPALGGLIHPEMTGLIGLVFALGLRHGFDPDHLVAIDGMTRSSARVRPGTSRWSGLFFSLGHGAVVTLVGLGVALAAADLRAPRWLEQLGAGISIGVLLVLGIGNLLMTARTPSGTAVPLVGMRGRWLGGPLVAGGIAKYVLPALEEQAVAFAPMLSVGSILLISAVYALASRFAVLR